MAELSMRQVEAALLRGPQGEFSHADLEGLPGPVASYFRAALSPGTPLALSARIRMSGRIKIGRWVPFTAREVLSPHVGFVWASRAAGIVSGSDRFVDGRGEMDWKLFGLIRVMRGSGPDVSRSAAERAAVEAIWVPSALLPAFGVIWSTLEDGRISARYQIGDYPVRVDLSTTGGGLIRSASFDRWGDPDGAGEFGLHPFGGDFSAHATFSGVTIPSEGRLGWHYGTDRWSEGEFFRYRISDLELYAVGFDASQLRAERRRRSLFMRHNARHRKSRIAALRRSDVRLSSDTQRGPVVVGRVDGVAAELVGRGREVFHQPHY